MTTLLLLGLILINNCRNKFLSVMPLEPLPWARFVNIEHLDFMQFNQTMCRMNWLNFARLHGPSYPSLIRLFHAGLSKPN